MSKSRKREGLWLGLAALSTVLLGGCMGMQSESTIDDIEAEGSNMPFVEAYIEYPGPEQRWVGPATFILHVVAKDSGGAQIAVSPNLFEDLLKNGASGRAPASKGMSGQKARDRMKALAVALQGANTNFRGCLYPVKVRLIRADGAVMEKQGCRGQSSWSKEASATVSDFIVASLPGR